jgi:hypothetical protein
LSGARIARNETDIMNANMGIILTIGSVLTGKGGMMMPDMGKVMTDL